jgi:hypothetical protein
MSQALLTAESGASPSHVELHALLTSTVLLCILVSPIAG